MFQRPESSKVCSMVPLSDASFVCLRLQGWSEAGLVGGRAGQGLV